MRVSNSYGDTNSHADCKSISNGDSYVYAYPDSDRYSYSLAHTYSASYGYTYRYGNASLHTELHIHIGHRNARAGNHRHWKPLR